MNNFSYDAAADLQFHDQPNRYGLSAGMPVLEGQSRGPWAAQQQSFQNAAHPPVSRVAYQNNRHVEPVHRGSLQADASRRPDVRELQRMLALSGANATGRGLRAVGDMKDAMDNENLKMAALYAGLQSVAAKQQGMNGSYDMMPPPSVAPRGAPRAVNTMALPEQALRALALRQQQSKWQQQQHQQQVTQAQLRHLMQESLLQGGGMGGGPGRGGLRPDLAAAQARARLAEGAGLRGGQGGGLPLDTARALGGLVAPAAGPRNAAYGRNGASQRGTALMLQQLQRSNPHSNPMAVAAAVAAANGLPASAVPGVGSEPGLARPGTSSAAATSANGLAMQQLLQLQQQQLQQQQQQQQQQQWQRHMEPAFERHAELARLLKAQQEASQAPWAGRTGSAGIPEALRNDALPHTNGAVRGGPGAGMGKGPAAAQPTPAASEELLRLLLSGRLTPEQVASLGQLSGWSERDIELLLQVLERQGKLHPDVGHVPPPPPSSASPMHLLNDGQDAAAGAVGFGRAPAAASAALDFPAALGVFPALAGSSSLSSGPSVLQQPRFSIPAASAAMASAEQRAAAAPEPPVEELQARQQLWQAVDAAAAAASSSAQPGQQQPEATAAAGSARGDFLQGLFGLDLRAAMAIPAGGVSNGLPTPPAAPVSADEELGSNGGGSSSSSSSSSAASGHASLVSHFGVNGFSLFNTGPSLPAGVRAEPISADAPAAAPADKVDALPAGSAGWSPPASASLPASLRDESLHRQPPSAAQQREEEGALAAAAEPLALMLGGLGQSELQAAAASAPAAVASGVACDGLFAFFGDMTGITDLDALEPDGPEAEDDLSEQLPVPASEAPARADDAAPTEADGSYNGGGSKADSALGGDA